MWFEVHKVVLRRSAWIRKKKMPLRPMPLSESVRRNLQSMPTKNSGPELELRRALHGLGLRFRLHAADLPGRPDVVFRRARVAVFVDGCFWHYCRTHCVLPRNNRAWWRDKLQANRSRDRCNTRTLTRDGWLVVRVWGHQDMVPAARRIRRVVHQRLRRFRKLPASGVAC